MLSVEIHTFVVLSVFSPQLYVTFWALSMYDLYVPLERYEHELTKLKQQLTQLDDNKDMVCYGNRSFRPVVL